MQLCRPPAQGKLEATGLHLALLITSKLEAFTTSSHVTSITLNSQPRVTYCLTPTFTGPATLPASPRHWLQGVALIEDALQSGGISSRKLSSCSSIKRNLNLPKESQRFKRLQHPHTCILHICHFFYTTTIWALKILHLKVHKCATKVASRQNSVN